MKGGVQPPITAADRGCSEATKTPMVEAVARALVRSRGAAVVASDAEWPATVAHYYRMVAEHGGPYADARSLVTDAMRDARAAIEASGVIDLLDACERCIGLLETVEAKALVGDEGCLWPVEIMRAAIAKAKHAEVAAKNPAQSRDAQIPQP